MYCFKLFLSHLSRISLSRAITCNLLSCLHSHGTLFNVELDKNRGSALQYALTGGTPALTCFLQLVPREYLWLCVC